MESLAFFECQVRGGEVCEVGLGGVLVFSGESRIFERGVPVFHRKVRPHGIGLLHLLLAIGGGARRRRKLLVFLALQLLISSVFFFFVA